VALAALGSFFAVLNGFGTGFSPYLPILLTNTLSFSIVGALIASRQRENTVGWLLLASGLLWGLTAFGGEYGYAFTAGARPGGLFGLWLGSWGWLAGGLTVLVSFLYFPDGRLPSPRWRVLAWLYGLTIFLEVAPVAFGPGPLFDTEALGSARVANPLGVEAVAGLSDLVATVSIPLAVFTGLPLVALVVRYQRAGERGRRQIKWVAYAVALLAGLITATSIWPPLDGSTAGIVLFVVGYQAIPAAVGIAILRHRLYDIDLVINRTLVYGSLTALLALVYFGGVTATQAIVQAFTGQGELPQLAIVVSTLVIAALFNPLRRRVQAFVDRRFYRRKYDAAKTLAAFNARLRDETDLDTLDECCMD